MCSDTINPNSQRWPHSSTSDSVALTSDGPAALRLKMKLGCKSRLSWAAHSARQAPALPRAGKIQEWFDVVKLSLPIAWSHTDLLQAQKHTELLFFFLG